MPNAICSFRVLMASHHFRIDHKRRDNIAQLVVEGDDWDVCFLCTCCFFDSIVRCTIGRDSALFFVFRFLITNQEIFLESHSLIGWYLIHVSTWATMEDASKTCMYIQVGVYSWSRKMMLVRRDASVSTMCLLDVCWWFIFQKVAVVIFSRSACLLE